MRIVTKQGRNRGELGPVIGGKAKKATTFSTATLALEGGARSFCLFFSSREPTVKDINLSSTAFWWKMKLSWQLEEQVFTDDLEGQNMSIWRHCYTVKCAGKMERKMFSGLDIITLFATAISELLWISMQKLIYANLVIVCNQLTDTFVTL